MSAITDNSKQAIDLKVLPAFAQFILEHYYDEFLKFSYEQLLELNIPLLNFFSVEEAEKISNVNNTELLLYLAHNNGEAHIKKAIDRWKTSHLRTLNRNNIVVDDITLVAYSRKQALLKFLPRYGNGDTNLVIELVKEIDLYNLEFTTTSFKTFVEIMDDRMEKHVQRLGESEALYKQAQALTHIGNYVWDLVSDKLTWSEELYRIYELDNENRNITRSLLSVYEHPEDAEAVKNHFKYALEKREPFSFYYRIILPAGRVKIVHTQGQILTDSDGRAIKMFGTVQDVTAQKETEKKLLENQTFIQRIADAIPAIIASYNVHSGKYTFINQGLRKLLGHDPQRVLDEGVGFFMKIIHPDDLEPLLKKNSEALKEANKRSGNNAETIIEFQYRMRHTNGEYRWFHTFGTVFQRNQQGEIQHVLNISLDITERVKAEDILVQRTHELQQSNSNLEEFAYVASHDLKEPLRKIAVFTNRMAMLKSKFTIKEQSHFEKVIKASLRMQQMIDDLLSLSLISSTLQNERCSMERIFQEVLQTFDHKIEELGASVTSDGLPDVFMVPAQVQQLFQNLVSNSLKFVRTNVRPVVNFTHRYLSYDVVAHNNLRPANRYLELQIADNGIGFEEEFQEKIFAVFQRLHHKHEYEGTGIGLAICRKIVTSYGGSIIASGRAGQGATFTIIIPQQ